MEFLEFRENLISETAVRAASDQDFTHGAFVDIAVQYLEDAGEVSDFQASYYRGKSGTRNVGLDGYAFDEADGSLRIFIADPTFSVSENLGMQEVAAKFSYVRSFAEDALRGKVQRSIDSNSPARAFAELLYGESDVISRFRIYLLSDATLSQKVKDWPDGDISGIPVEYHIWDASRFFRLYSSTTGQDELVVDFRGKDSVGIPCIEAHSIDSPYTAYLCVIPGAVLANIYEQYGSRLLEGNVRSFLSARGRINKGIRNTILHEPAMFFAYNNGIAATATKVKVESTSDGLRLIAAEDLQIVNGGQTTASLSATSRNDTISLDSIFVPMKLSVLDVSLSGELIPNISKYANSQNKVSESDFFSNHSFHRRLEPISRRLWAPAKPGAQHETKWFYERAKGSYDNEMTNLTIAQKKRFLEANPKSQMLSKTDLAKSENSWRMLPYVVSRGAQSSFLEFADYISKEWTNNDTQFNEKYFKDIVAKLIIFRSAEKIVREQPWFLGGYRANIVTYCIARIAQELYRSGRASLNFAAIWQQQSISVALASQIAISAKAMYDVIIDPKAGQQNVTQWCKRQECWEQAKLAPCPLSDELKKELIGLEVLREESRLAKASQALDSGISSQAMVINIKASYWLELSAFAKSKRLIAPEDQRLVDMLTKNPPRVPTGWQCDKILKIKEQMISNGMRPVVAADLDSVANPSDGLSNILRPGLVDENIACLNDRDSLCSVGEIEEQIREVEGFDVVFVHADTRVDVRSDRGGLPPYPFMRALSGDKNVGELIEVRLESTFKDMDLRFIIYHANGTRCYAPTKLQVIRDGYGR